MSLSLCTSLVHVDLSYNNLYGTVPSNVLIAMTDLVAVNVSNNCGLCGPLPRYDAPSVTFVRRGTGLGVLACSIYSLTCSGGEVTPSRCVSTAA